MSEDPRIEYIIELFNKTFFENDIVYGDINRVDLIIPKEYIIDEKLIDDCLSIIGGVYYIDSVLYDGKPKKDYYEETVVFYDCVLSLFVKFHK